MAKTKPLIDESTEDVIQPVDESTEDVVYVVIGNVHHNGVQYTAGEELTDLLDLQASVLVAHGVIAVKAD